MRRLLRSLATTVVATLALATVSWTPAAQAAGGPNLSLGKTASASSANGAYAAGNLNDGNAASYWESNGAFPQWAQLDLGSVTSIDQVVLKLPTGWGARSQTLAVQGSTNGTSFADIKPSAAYAFDPASGNTVTVTFAVASTRYVRVVITANTGWAAAQLSELEVYGTSTSATNLAQGRPTTESGHADVYGAGNVVDGNPATYWESANNAFPQWAGVDLGSAVSVGKVVLKLPPTWGTRTQTLSIETSTDGTAYSTAKASAAYAFDPSVAANSVTISFTAVSARYVRVRITANTGWPAGQLSELEVYSAGVVDDAPPTVPGTLSFTQSGTTITLAWGASTDIGSGLAGYDVFRDGSLAATVGQVTTWQDTQPTTATVSYYVRARDNAGNVSANSNTVTRTGTSPDTTAPTVPGTLAYAESGTTITLTWGASTDSGGSGLAGYTVYRDGSAIATLGSVLTYQDTQPTTATVSYYVRARDGAGNLSGNSNTVTRTGHQPPACSNVALNKPVTATGSVFTFTPDKATDGNVTTYWEGSASYPQDLTVALGANHAVSSVTVKLNPDSAWGTRSQTFQVLGRDQASTTYTSLVAAAAYNFGQGVNTVTVPVTATTADIRLRFTANTGAASGQVAELEVCGTAAPNPDLTVSTVAWSPASPDETSSVSLSATVTNTGDLASAATTLAFALNGTQKATVTVPAIGAGGSAPVSVSVGTLAMGTYAVSATVDPANTVFEKNEGNNSAANATSMVVAQAPGPDLQVLGIAPNPANPAAGQAVSFTVTLKNRGTTATGVTSVTRLTVAGTTLNTNTASVGAGATVTVPVTGTWTATAGGATITATADATGVVTETNETNNLFSQAIVVGRGAALPYTEYEAESASYSGTLLTADPLRTFGHTNFATESSGRQSVRLDNAGQYVEFTATNQANSIVVRNSIPDAPSGGGIDRTLSLYINGAFAQKITLSSRNSWLYGTTDDTESLSNSPQANARRLFDESHALLPASYPPGTKFRLQRDSGDTATFYIVDFIDLEQVAPELTKPAECTSITQYGAIPNDGLDDTSAIQRAVTDDENGVISCVWIPAGQWRQEQKILSPDPTRNQYNQKGIRNAVIKGAGMWYTTLYTNTEPQNVVGNINHPHEGNVGFDIDDNVQLSDLAIFGMTTNRANRGHGLNGRFGKNTKVANLWIEHVNVGAWVGRDYSDTPAYWNPGDGLQFSGMRIRDTYADGINFSNGTRNSTVFNSSFRTTGDDSLAVWANPYVKDQSVDIGHDNHFTNNTIQLPWRANGAAIYGGYGNTIENNLIFDTMNYPGIMLATDHSPLPFSGTTTVANNALYRAGGVFWGEAQEFGAITLFASTTDIVGVTIRDTEIYDSTYDGIQFKTGGGSMPNVKITNVRVQGSVNGAGILAMGGARGNAVLSNVTCTGNADGNIVIQPGSQFQITGS
ncbi:discoidin domain-containing protein [Hamadaea sp. NPDC051192]|uniref:galactose-binding domain-containing protein n=1 Tax=Hamadaea sp. NPDC051192 TaxID=3154940 RepID=UPI00344A5ED7